MATQRVTKTLGELEKELAQLNMRGQWQFEDVDISDGPKPRGVPHVWKWGTIHEKLLDACEAMPESFTARRALTLMNPGLPHPGSTHTIVMAVQMVMAGEIAWAHRHSMAAIRFAIEGDERLYTAVNGDRLAMEPNDLVLTPAWTWHDHHNESQKTGMWLDVLDVPMTMILNQGFYEPFGESVQPLNAKNSDLPWRYPWSEYGPRLYEKAKHEFDPCDGTLLEYTDPRDGGPTLPTFTCAVQHLRPGFEGKEHRHTSSSVYYVVKGSGRTITPQGTIEWSERDAFAIPNWVRHRHINDSSTNEVVLFSVSDAPALKKLGFYREQA